MTSRVQTNTNVKLLKRPKVSFNLDNITEMAKENDPLPIVEIKPFVHKVWRREKSLPGFYARSDTSGNTQSNANKDVNVTGDSISTESPQPTQPTPTPPPKLVHFYVSQFSDFKSQKEHINKLVGESEFKSKAKIHPHVDSRTKKRKQHSESLIPGFITREDRTKSTFSEISEDESSSKHFSCLNKALKPEDYLKQQEIKVSGQRIDPDLGKSPFESFGLSPFRQLYMAAWHGGGIRHGSPASMLYHNWSKNEKTEKRAKTPFYDHLDRKGTLPSLTIKAKGLRRRSPNLRDDRQSEDYNDYREAFKPDVKHNVGGIKNSFKVLSKYGQPTKVERQLSFELEVSLSRLRKAKDYFPFEISDKYSEKYYPTPAYSMTHGEMQLRQGLQSNASSRRRKIKSRGMTYTSQSTMQSTADASYAQALLKMKTNEIDHLDSFDQTLEMHDYQHVNFDRGMILYDRDQGAVTATTTEDELRFETPRSFIESRLTMKPTESVIEETQEEPATENTNDANDEKEIKVLNNEEDPGAEVSPSTSVSLEEHIHTNSRASRTEDINQNNVPNAEDLNTGLGKELKGQTFITRESPGSVSVNG